MTVQPVINPPWLYLSPEQVCMDDIYVLVSNFVTSTCSVHLPAQQPSQKTETETSSTRLILGATVLEPSNLCYLLK